MKIAFITNLCTHYRYKLFKLLSEKHGFDLYFFDDESKTKEDIKHLKIYKGNGFRYLPTIKILKKLFKNKYDVLIKCTNNKWSFCGSFLVSRLIGSKFIVWHSIWYYPKTLQYKLFSWLLLKTLKDYSDAIVVYGEHGKKFLVDKGIKPEKIFIAWQTVDNEIFAREVIEDEVLLIKKKLNIPENKKIVLYVGRLNKLKGLEYLLEAISRLDKEKIIFVAIGHGDMKCDIEKFCSENNIDYRYVGLIPFNELPPYYKMAECLVLPSITTKTFKEPWGLVANEAFNQGCPVVITNSVGAGGLVKDGINGLIVPEKNISDLINAINKIINDDELRKKMSINAKKEIKKWTYERQSQGFLDAIQFSWRLK